MTSNEERYKELLAATYISLNQTNKSSKSMDLCALVTKSILKVESRKRNRKAIDEVAFRVGVERILSSLMLAAAVVESRWAYRSMCNNSFSGEVVKGDTFKKIISLLETIGYIEKNEGSNHSNPFHIDHPESNKFHPGLATRLRATNKLLSLAESIGITKDTTVYHYKQCLPTNVIKKKAKSMNRHGKKISGRQMVVKRDKTVMILETEILSINEYLNNQDFEGGIFNGYIRTFNMGDEPYFDWNKGGRISCPGKDSYQKMQKKVRLKTIKVNNESVAEVDINASYLSIFYGLSGHSLPKKDDLYAVPGLHRDIVKTWITTAFGKGTFPSRWPSKAKAELINKGISLNKLTMREVGQIVCEAIPVLQRLPTSNIKWADLMFKESEAIISAMVSLRENFNIPAYSMHDGLIVPLSGKDIAANEIMRAFDDFGLECRVKIETQA